MKFQATLATALLATGMIGPAHAATATFITASPYAQFSDSPFAALAAGNPNFFLENFEDGSLNTPGATASAGFAVSGGLFIDSVDGDDGSLDGSGLNGHSWYTGFAPTTLSFSFSAAAPRLFTDPRRHRVDRCRLGAQRPAAKRGQRRGARLRCQR